MSFAGLRVKTIVAFDTQRAIGRDGKLPWHLPEDMRRFSQLTRGHTVLMGRTTWESLPPKYRPLPDRLNIVLSTSIGQPVEEASKDDEPNSSTIWVPSLDMLEQRLLAGDVRPPSDVLWVIGGSAVYESTQDLWDEVFLTRVDGSHEGDRFFPNFEADYARDGEEAREGFSFVHYTRIALE